MTPDATHTQTTIAQDARLAYETYRDALRLSFPLTWERLPARTQHAWRAVALALRTTSTEDGDDATN